jgi:hypothetical protein
MKDLSRQFVDKNAERLQIAGRVGKIIRDIQKE